MKVAEMEPALGFVSEYCLSQMVMCMTYWQLTMNFLERTGEL
jgi:hypothetical protein